MKFTCTVTIKAPRDKVIGLYTNIDNLKYWQDGFQSYEHLSGEIGAVGSKARMIYKSGKRTIELIETILVLNLPDEFNGHYAAKEMENTMSNRFTIVNDSTTRYDAEVEYTQFNSILVKAMAFLFPGMFKKQVQKWLDQFRDFVEQN